ncbi:hypothetical protein ILUMI_25549 [Ignelater luminosus]|uniref:Reverse transcriptase domain-containing protein n=1 Tax=Ignelater luminosus TaxID=2038154 RepID=A0A8K0CBI0_IGNLU|nr:hypothetical protein ILUMI_25549 [Ignelater luminosus]
MTRKPETRLQSGKVSKGDLCSPVEVDEKTYQELTDILVNHFKPTRLIIDERFKFNTRVQQQDESISEFVVALNHLAKICNFGTFLKDALRDRLLCGIKDSHIQHRLRTVESDFDETLKKALLLEEASKNANLFSVSQSTLVNKIQASKNASKFNNYNKNKYKTVQCTVCSKMGHSQSVSLNQVNPPIQLTVSVSRKKVLFDLDTGCAFTLLSEEVYEACVKTSPWIKTSLQECNIKLKAYWFKKPLPIMGKAIVNVGYKGKNFSRDWIKSIELLNYNSAGTITISNIVSAGTVDQDVINLKKKFKSVFDLHRRKILGHEAKLVFRDENVGPIFCKARPVAYAIKDAVEKELKRLVNSGVLKPVTNSEWASPVVVVSKPDGSIRICADFKITINRFLSKEHYPLPSPKDIYASLAGGVVFTSLDLSEAYLQLPVHKESQPLLTINTHVELLQYQRLAFGIAPGPSKFQKIMDRILIGPNGTSCYLDNILIAGKSREDCLKKTLLVLERLQNHNIRVRVDKCDFFVSRLKYLGHIIDKNGIRSDEELLKAIKFAPRPTNKTELKSYLGLINFNCHFVKNLSGNIVPLYELTEKGKQWEWSKECESIFKGSKHGFALQDVLSLYDPTKKLKLTYDSSCYGVGAVLSHVINGEEKPISFASKTLSSAEKN